MGKAEWGRVSELAFREKLWTDVPIAVVLNVGVRYFAPEEHLTVSGDIFDC